MSPVVGPSSGVTSPELAAPQLRLAHFDDYEQIARLGSPHFEVAPLGDWRGFWLDNPVWERVGKQWPIGWVLQIESGEIAGVLLNVPSLYRFRGQELICGFGRYWAVADAYRGYALWLIDEYFSQADVDLFINNDPAPITAPIHERLEHRVPLGDWQTASYWLISHVGFARGKLGRLHAPLPGLLAYPVGGALWLRDAILNKRPPQLHHAGSIEITDRFDSRFDTFWDELVRQNTEKLLADRSSRTLSWHFAIPLRKRQLWIFTASQSGKLRAYCVLNCKENGREVRLVDYQTIEADVDLLPGLLAAALQRCAREKVHLLENFGRGVPKMRVVDDCAPYRKKVEAWRFFFRAADPALDKALLSARFWDPSAYDGDASLQ
jgi:hypothetical protein